MMIMLIVLLAAAFGYLVSMLVEIAKQDKIYLAKLRRASDEYDSMGVFL